MSCSLNRIYSQLSGDDVQINLIAQNWVENPAYFPPEFVATDAFKEAFKSVPMPRLATPEEDALFDFTFRATNITDLPAVTKGDFISANQKK